SRKQEQAPEEIRRQRSAYRKLASEEETSVIVDSSRMVPEMTTQAVKALTRCLEVRVFKRHGEWVASRFSASDRLAHTMEHFGSRATPDQNSVFEFGALPSLNDPRWLIPLRNGRVADRALHLYQPYKLKAKILKTLAPLLLGAAPRCILRRQFLTASRSPFDLDCLTAKLTGEPHPLLTFSIGEPGEYRKMTVQAMRPNAEILGYFKVPLTDTARRRVQHEATMLAQLREFPSLAPHIPEVMFADVWKDEYVLFQAPVAGMRGPIRFTAMHLGFLEKLWNAQSCSEAGTLLVDDVRQRWAHTDGLIAPRLQALGDEALLIASEQLKSISVPCGIS